MWSPPASASSGCSLRGASGSWARRRRAPSYAVPSTTPRSSRCSPSATSTRTPRTPSCAREFSEAHREATGRLVESAYEQVVAAVSAGQAPCPRARPRAHGHCAHPRCASPRGRPHRPRRLPRRRAGGGRSPLARQAGASLRVALPAAVGRTPAERSRAVAPPSGSSRRSVPSASGAPSRARSGAQPARTPSRRHSAPR